MPSDKDRLSFDAKQQYHRLVEQQGRCITASDFNEAQEIAEHERREEALDFVGPTGTPDNGYAIAIPGSIVDFTVSPGTMYVGGVRVEIGWRDKTNQVPYDYSHQPEWLDPVPPATGVSKESIVLTLREQEMGAVEDPNLRDSALGGPDTAERTRMVQQIERFPTTASDCTSALNAQILAWNTSGLDFDPASMRLESRAKLKFGFDSTTSSDKCEPIAQGGYFGENQLIRVRISGPRTFVWGFDNASFLYRVALGANRTLTLGSAPVDHFHFPGNGQAVELLRTQAILPDGEFIAYDLGQVLTLDEDYDPDTQTQRLPLGFAVPATTPQLFLRVWKQEVTFTPGTPAPLAGTGISVTLTAPGDTFHTGDFWAFAVRPNNANTPVQVYPKRYLAGEQPPDGPKRWVCPLAIIDWTIATPGGGGGSNDLISGVLVPGLEGRVLADCRNKFENLVELTKRKPGASCCTIVLKPEDLSATRTLVDVIEGLRGTPTTGAPFTICLQRGSYPLPRPIVLDNRYSGLTIEGCHPDVDILPAPGAGILLKFLPGVVVLNGASHITLRGLNFPLPRVPFVNAGGLLANIPLNPQTGLGALVNDLHLADLETGIGIRLANATDVHIERCTFEFQGLPGPPIFEAGVFAIDDCAGLVLQNNEFSHADTSHLSPVWQARYGFLMTPSISSVAVTKSGVSLSSSDSVVSIALAEKSRSLTLNVLGQPDGPIGLASSNLSAATVPASVTLPPNQTSVGVPVNVVAAGATTITASAQGMTTSVTVNVVAALPIVLPPVTAVQVGQPVSFPVTLPLDLNAVVTIALSSSDPLKVAVSPAQLVFQPHQTVFNASLTGTGAGPATIRAVPVGVSSVFATATQNIQATQAAPPVTITLSPPNLTITGTTPQPMTVLLSALPPAQITVSLSFDASIVTVQPNPVSIPAGQNSAQIMVTGVSTGMTSLIASPPIVGTATARLTVILPITSIAADALPAFLDRAKIFGNSFSNLTAAALINAEIGNLLIGSNTVRFCSSGFHLYTLRFQWIDISLATPFKEFAAAIGADAAFVFGSVLGQGFPKPQGFTPSQSLIPVTGAPWLHLQPLPEDPIRKSVLELAGAFAGAGTQAFTLRQGHQRRRPSSILATTNDIANAGAGTTGFVFWGEDSDTDCRLVVSANSILGQVVGAMPLGAVLRAAYGAITGNVILNQSGGAVKASLVVGPGPSTLTPVITGVAITGNTLRGTPALPDARWNPLNLIIPN